MMDRFEQFTGLISAASRCVQKIERDEMEKLGFRGACAQYLPAIARFPEGVTAAQLCEICDKDKAAVSRVVAELLDKGLVLRQCVNNNPYRARLTLTEQGYKVAAFISRRAELAVEMAGTGLEEQDRQVFYAAFSRITANLQKISGEGLPD